jgi:hypothetical protein
LLVEFDEAGELSAVARVAELGEVLGVGVEGDQSNDIGGIVVASGWLISASELVQTTRIWLTCQY